MKIKRTSRSAAALGAPSKGAGARKGAEQTGGVERAEIADKVTLSEGVLAVGGVQAVAKTDADKAGGPLPDPKATSKAIIEKELASVFKEIYL